MAEPTAQQLLEQGLTIAQISSRLKLTTGQVLYKLGSLVSPDQLEQAYSTHMSETHPIQQYSYCQVVGEAGIINSSYGRISFKALCL